MFREYEKGVSVTVGPNFLSTEFDCNCKRPECRITIISDLQVAAMEVLRSLIGPIHISCGFRCAAHNSEVGGAKDSRHMHGDATDIKSVAGMTPHRVAKEAERVNPFFNGGIGVYGTFTHLDSRGYKARWRVPGYHEGRGTDC